VEGQTDRVPHTFVVLTLLFRGVGHI
jgi:hypothetical protein